VLASSEMTAFGSDGHRTRMAARGPIADAMPGARRALDKLSVLDSGP